MFRCLPYQVEDLAQVNAEHCVVNSRTIDSPILQAEDLAEALRAKLSQHRILRRKVSPVAVVALLNISRSQLNSAHPKLANEGRFLLQGDDIDTLLDSLSLDDEQWRLLRSTCQSASALSKFEGFVVASEEPPITLGAAIQCLEKEIALLDSEQEKAAIQLPPGPQRIRGLAGTGKTVLLAMKAAQLHLRFPTRRTLFTFHTKSLYNQAQALITRFYRAYADSDPNWEFVHCKISQRAGSSCSLLRPIVGNRSFAGLL